MLAVVVIVLAVILLAWIPMLIFGIVSLRRQNRGLGIVLTILGGVWGASAVIFGIGLLVFGMLFYSVRSQFKMETFDAAKYKGDTGTLVISDPGCDVTGYFSLNDKHPKNYQMKSKEPSKLTLPVGQYTISYLCLSKKDEAGNKYDAYIYSGPSTKLDVIIRKGEETQLEIGAPFTASVTGSRTVGNRYTFSFDMKDCANRKATLYCSQGNKPPSFQLVDFQGKVLMQKNMEYG